MIGPLLLAVAVTVAPPSEQGGVKEPTDEKEGGSQVDWERALGEVLASCENALGTGECTRPEEDEDTWHAVVVFTADGAKVTLSRPNRVIVRNLEFSTEDSEKQRRVAAGLLVAAMTAAARLSEPEFEEQRGSREERESRVRAESSQPDAAAPTAESLAPWAPAEPEKPHAGGPYSAELVAMIGSTLGGPHFGGGGAASLALRLRPHFSIGLGVGGLYSRRDDFEVMKLDGSAGPRVNLLPASKILNWELAAEGVIDFTQVSYLPGESDARGAVRGGGRVRTSWTLGSARLRPLLGVAVTSLSPVLEIQADGTSETVVPSFLGSAFLGIVYKPAP